MNPLRRFLDKIKPNFEKGGKFEKLHSTYDAFATFLFVPNTVTRKGAHIRDASDLKRTMTVVILALVPTVLFGMWNAGFQNAEALGDTRTLWENFWFGFLRVFPIIVVSYVVGLSIEFGVAQARGHEVNEGFLVSGILIPLVMPVGVPLWMVAVATAFSVVFAKEIFGGTGMNIWNPALIARAFLFFAYPSEISGDKVWVSGIRDQGVKLVDGFSGATPLAEAAAGQPITASLCDMFLGLIPGSIGETSTLAILIGAAILLITGVGSWRIMLSVFAGGALMGLILNWASVYGALLVLVVMAIFIIIWLLVALIIKVYDMKSVQPLGTFLTTMLITILLTSGVVFLLYKLAWLPGIRPINNPYLSLPFYYHFVMGGFAFGAVFMATDPVSGSHTDTGKWIYGFMIGFIAVLIRVFNPTYPEGMMLSILLLNTFAPLIDYYVVNANINRRLKRAVVRISN